MGMADGSDEHGLSHMQDHVIVHDVSQSDCF